MARKTKKGKHRRKKKTRIDGKKLIVVVVALFVMIFGLFKVTTTTINF